MHWQAKDNSTDVGLRPVNVHEVKEPLPTAIGGFTMPAVGGGSFYCCVINKLLVIMHIMKKQPI